MSRLRFRTVHWTALIFMLACLSVVTGCKKKTPPPPPPPVQTPPPPPPAKPSISSFTAEPTSIEPGQSSTLRWAVSDATDINIDQGVGAVQSEGSRAVSPASTTTYTLSARGPGGTDSRSVTVEVTTPQPPPPPAPVQNNRTGADIINQDVKDVYFDYNKSDIRGDAQAVLQTDADVLKKVFADDPSIAVLVEGNCDERGSAEYNLALGDRRASAAKDYLVQLGVPADRLKTVSYGKEKPVCTDATEDCYQRNRHDHFAPAQK